MTANERYEKVWNGFLTLLQRDSHARLAPYLASHHVYQCGFEKWMYGHGYSVGEAKNRIRGLLEEARSEKDSFSCDNACVAFLPAEITSDAGTAAVGVLSGVSLTMPDGTVVSIRKGSPQAVVSFIRLYAEGGVPCSD